MSTPGMGAREMHGLQPDSDLSDYPAIVEVVMEELRSATAKFPPMHGMHEGYAILLEEVDELWSEVKTGETFCALEEAVQVAAMALRFIHDVQALQATGAGK